MGRNRGYRHASRDGRGRYTPTPPGPTPPAVTPPASSRLLRLVSHWKDWRRRQAGTRGKVA